MPERFYFPESLQQKSIELTGSEVHHLLNVLRMKAGDEVEIFNGRGEIAKGVIQSSTKRSVILELHSAQNEDDSDETKIIVASAVPKGDRFRWMIEKMTELNVAEFIPLSTLRSVVDPGKGKMTKMEQTIISACKQSGRNQLMRINPKMSWDELCQNQSEYSKTVIAHPGGFSLQQTMNSWPNDEPLESILLVVGPEGGFSDEEIDKIKNDKNHVVSLGKHILRMETAVISGSTILQNRNE